MEQQRRLEEKWFNDVVNSLAKVVIIELGAGTAIPWVRHFCQRIGSEFKAPIIRINPREFEVSRSIDVGLPMGALEALQGIDIAMSGLERK